MTAILRTRQIGIGQSKRRVRKGEFEIGSFGGAFASPVLTIGVTVALTESLILPPIKLLAIEEFKKNVGSCADGG